MNDRSGRRADSLVNRISERAALDQLASAIRVGESRVLVLRGEPGVGKTVLLTYLNRSAAQCRVIRAAGVQSEMELAFAGLHQLLAPARDAQLLARVAGAALATERLTVEQMGAGEVCAGAGTPEARYVSWPMPR
jgi:predicted ATP-dependent serine protease